MFPNLNTLANISVLIPVSTASVEKFFADETIENSAAKPPKL